MGDIKHDSSFVGCREKAQPHRTPQHSASVRPRVAATLPEGSLIHQPSTGALSSINPQPGLSHPSTLHLVLTRLFTKGEYTHGSLSIDGNKICSTLENANALVPAGDYPIHLIKCKQYARKMPCLNPNAPCDLCPN